MEVKEKTNIVLLGSWNLGILTPSFFANEFSDLKMEKDINVEMILGTGGFRFSVQNIIINPNPNKLILFSTINDYENYNLMEEIAIKIVEKLHYTPIMAVGHNISYFTDSAFKLFENDKLDQCEEFYKKETSTIALNSQEVKHALSYENYTLNLTYNVNRQRNYVTFNYNYPTNNSDNNKTIEYLGSFKKNIEESKVICTKLVKENAK